MDPAGTLRLKAQTATNIDAMLVWISSTWINVSRIMHPLDYRSREATELPGFLFSSQIASLMLVEMKYLLPLIFLIVWPIFGAVMALRNPTQPLKVVASTPIFSLLHFVSTDNS